MRIPPSSFPTDQENIESSAHVDGLSRNTPVREADYAGPVGLEDSSLIESDYVEEDLHSEEDSLSEEEAVLRRAAMELAERNAELRAAGLMELARAQETNSVEVLTRSLEDVSPSVRNAAARALYELNPEGATSLFNDAIREGPPERRRYIGGALVGSGLISEAIEMLENEDGQYNYVACALVFLLAKSGDIRSLMDFIERHPRIDLRVAVIRLLASARDPEVLEQFHRLMLSTSLAPRIRSAVMAAIYEMSKGGRKLVSAS